MRGVQQVSSSVIIDPKVTLCHPCVVDGTAKADAPGHEIVATIAQVHLRPDVREKLCTILPAQAKCHLAPIAAWADQVRGRYPGSGPMHYINGTSRFILSPH